MTMSSNKDGSENHFIMGLDLGVATPGGVAAASSGPSLLARLLARLPSETTSPTRTPGPAAGDSMAAIELAEGRRRADSVGQRLQNNEMSMCLKCAAEEGEEGAQRSRGCGAHVPMMMMMMIPQPGGGERAYRSHALRRTPCVHCPPLGLSACGRGFSVYPLTVVVVVTSPPLPRFPPSAVA